MICLPPNRFVGNVILISAAKKWPSQVKSI